MENLVVSKDMRDRILSNVEKEMAKGGDAVSFDVISGEKKGTSKIVTFRRYAGIAAAFAVLVVGAYAVNIVRTYDSAMSSTSMKAEETAATSLNTAFDSDQVNMAKEEMATETMAAGAMEEMEEAAVESAESVDSFEAKEFASLIKMSREAGTQFKEIQYLDSFSTGKDYYLYNGNVAVISYDVEGNKVIVREMDALYGDSIPDEVGASKAGLGSSENLLAGDIAVSLHGNDELYTLAEWTKDGLIFQLESSEALTYEDIKELMEFVVQ
ncbi:MAG: hypothetical protein K6F75_02335 [Butyrivibrio sp.]|nr:hypothetical protein [Butyrivibrio sp.]